MAQSKTVHPNDRTRFVKLSLVIIEELTPLLQDTLQNKISPNQIFNQVSRHKSLFQKLRAEQIALVQSAQNDGYKEFDITLSYTLLRNLKCIKVTAPTQGWGTSQMPGNGETTLGDDIERIRLIRNNIYGHITSPSLSETEFKEHWTNILDICKRMQNLLGKNYVQSLQTAEIRAIDMEMESTYLEKIKNLSTAEKSTRELLQDVIQNRAPCVEETVDIKARNPQNPRKRKLAETLIDTSISILNDMKDGITKTTSDSEIELLYELIEEFISENKEDASKLASSLFFEELKQKIIKRYAHLKRSQMQTLARYFRFILRLNKMYGAELESSKGSLLLTMTFSSERGYDLYMQDFESGEIGKLIRDVLLFPPYLDNFDLHAEDLIIYLNANELTTENMLTERTPESEMLHPRRKSTPQYAQCSDHVHEYCEHYCEKCDIPVCSICISSEQHKGHGISDILEKLDTNTERLQKDLEELETRIYPRYEEMASDVQIDKAELERNYLELTTYVDQEGETIHNEITAIVNQRKATIQEMKKQHLSTLNKSSDGITMKITQLKQIIANLKSILKLNDASLTSTYKSRNSEFRTLPLKVRVALPSFSPQKLNKDQLNQSFSSLPLLSINTEHGEIIKSSEVIPSPLVNPLHDESQLTASTIDTKYDSLLNVCCLCEEQLCTLGDSEYMKLFDLQGKLLAKIKTKSGTPPHDIAVRQDGYLVYTDFRDRTVNLVRNKHILTVITLQEWYPLFLCSTAADDLLVTMISDDKKQSKVVRYSGSTETQSIQFDEQGHPLYSSDVYSKYINENGNLDICVSDSSAVVVVNQAGKLRFRYTGNPSNTNESFHPAGITTDHQSHILIADWYSDRIHILNKDGQFLRYIYNVRSPYGLCVNINGDLYVAECNTARVKKIQYIKT